jgi:SM-20-related protein
LEKIFDQLINSFVDDHVGIANHFLSNTLSSSLKQNLIVLNSENKLRLAGIGNTFDVKQDTKIRGDRVYWLDRKHENLHENAFLDLIDAFVLYLNRTCFTGITGYEFHYTYYEIGTYYKKHLDQFKNNHSRQFSMICYLNENWELKDGGELRIYNLESHQNISPQNGKSVFFRSNELLHEVLTTNKERLSITGWFKIN